MATRRQTSARFLAPAALSVFAVALLVVIAASLSGGGDESAGPIVAPPVSTQGSSGGEGSGEAASEYYVVRPGDNLVRISARTGLSVQALQSLNPDLDPQALVSGQRVRLSR